MRRLYNNGDGMNLRSYQQSIFDKVINSSDDDLVQLDTGAGKTPIIAKLAEYYEHAAIICHRNILIKQASEKLAMCGLEHRIIGANSTKKICARNNVAKVGRHFINPAASIYLVSIDTINSRIKRVGKGLDDNTKIILIDEAHHVAEDNKWFYIADSLNVRCVGFTATPCRGDGQPMLKQYGGFFDKIIQAEGYEENGTERLIAEGYLAQYRCIYYKIEDREVIYDNGVDIEIWVGDADIEAGDRGAEIIDVARKYCKKKQTILIEPRIDNAIYSVDELAKAGYSSAVIHSKMPQYDIEKILDEFDNKNVQILVAVDMINEGFDVPDADVLIINRKVNSFGLYRQLCGRVLRPRENKQALIIDVCGHAVAQHGLPSDNVDWNKKQGEIRRRDLTICCYCDTFFKATLTHCPYCGEFNDLSMRHEGRGEGIELFFYTAKEVELERKKIAAREQQKLIEEQERKEAERARKEYFNFSPKFDDSLVGRRCAQLYCLLQTELRKQLTPEQYNNFYKNNDYVLQSESFYIKSMPRNFENNPAAVAAKIYGAHK